MTVHELLELTRDLHDAILRRVVMDRSDPVTITLTLDAEIRGSGIWRSYELAFSESRIVKLFDDATYFAGVVFEAGVVETEGMVHFALDPHPTSADSRYEIEELAAGVCYIKAGRVEIRDLGEVH